MKFNKGPGPLKRRTFKYKNPAMEFYCPLCRTPRAFTTSPRLSLFNYAQVFAIGGALMWVLFPIMNWKSFFVFFTVWLGFEMVIRARFRKEIPCPDCGFDASWYKRDVKVARQKVSEFWNTEEPKTESEASLDAPAPYIEPAYEESDNPYF